MENPNNEVELIKKKVLNFTVEGKFREAIDLLYESRVQLKISSSQIETIELCYNKLAEKILHGTISNENIGIEENKLLRQIQRCFHSDVQPTPKTRKNIIIPILILILLSIYLFNRKKCEPSKQGIIKIIEELQQEEISYALQQKIVAEYKETLCDNIIEDIKVVLKQEHGTPVAEPSLNIFFDKIILGEYQNPDIQKVKNNIVYVKLTQGNL